MKLGKNIWCRPLFKYLWTKVQGNPSWNTREKKQKKNVRYVLMLEVNLHFPQYIFSVSDIALENWSNVPRFKYGWSAPNFLNAIKTFGLIFKECLKPRYRRLDLNFFWLLDQHIIIIIIRLILTSRLSLQMAHRPWRSSEYHSP